MRFLLHGSLAPALTGTLRRHEHQAKTSAEAGIDTADPVAFLQAAHKQQFDIVTGDPRLVETAYEQKAPFARSIVFLQLEGGDVEQDHAIDRLFARYKRLSPGRLYTVTATRVKVRQLPSA
jgi:hypothetical protein